MKTVVIALGGNALLSPSGKQSFSREVKAIRKACDGIAAFCRSQDTRLVITYGNGSQVGNELIRNEHARKFVPRLPLYELDAETQASIGTSIETSLSNSLGSRGIKRNVCVVLAHVIVDKNDEAFKVPSKPIGPFYTKSALTHELKLERFSYVKVGSTYRRIVPSPKPKKILEINSIASLSGRSIVITCGGGGIPLIKRRLGALFEVNAIIDKDLTTQLLANSLKAETMVILTNADAVYQDYSKRKGRIKQIQAKVLKDIANKFESGTMRPKVEACIKFIENGGKEAYIGNVYNLAKILSGVSGTKIT